MRIRSSFVSLLDISEVLPFTYRETKDMDHEEKVLAKLSKFVDVIEKQFKEEVCFIGDDIIGEKFYYRFLFKKGGFLEVMVQPPVAMIAHFIEQSRAKKFAEALKKTIDKTIEEKKAREILKNVIEVSTENEALSYEKWTKLRKIRSL